MDLLKSAAFREHAKSLMEEYHLPGLSIAISQNNKVSSIGLGVANLLNAAECTPDTLYDIASSSKSLTAASVALLVEDDENYPEVKWDTPLHDLLPEDFVMPTPELTERITIVDVLSHRTGMALHDLSYLGYSAEHKEFSTPRDITRKMRGLPMASPEKQKYMLYNNMMFTVASHLIEVKTGLSFKDFLNEKFFQPLGMTSTHLHPPSAKGWTDRMACGHQFDKSGKTTTFAIPYAPEAQGAGSIVTSSADYIKWVQAMLHRQAPISEASYRALTQPRILIDPEDRELDPFCSHQLYCLGWETYHYRGHQVVIHEGLIDGFGSSHFFLPAHGFGAVILGNADGIEQVCWILARELIDAALKVPESERPDWAALQAAKLAKGGDAGTPQDQLRELRAELSSGERPEKPAPALETFVGTYCDVGYGVFKVGIRDGSLFIDAMDRGFKCTFVFEHVRTSEEAGDGSGDAVTRSSMIAHLLPLRGSVDEYLAAEFVLIRRSDGDYRASRMSIALDPDTETIWFDRTEEDAGKCQPCILDIAGYTAGVGDER